MVYKGQAIRDGRLVGAIISKKLRVKIGDRPRQNSGKNMGQA